MVIVDIKRVGVILENVRSFAIEYYSLTGKPLGITGEIGEYLTAKLLGLQLVDARTAGYDAIDDNGRKIQIKCRSIPQMKRIVGQRMGSLRLQHEWDAVALILLNERFEPQWIYEADRSSLEEALMRPGSRSRNERGALAIAHFKRIGRKVWPLP